LNDLERGGNRQVLCQSSCHVAAPEALAMAVGVISQ
jgi:hypothetical protein